MPRPKYEPWDESRSNRIKARRVEVGLGSPDRFAAALTEAGVDLSSQAYMRRERGETPITVDELGGIAKVLGLSIADAFELYSRTRNALKHS